MANWDITTAGASLEFDTQDGEYNSCYQIDNNHFINFWRGADSDGYVQTFTVNTSTWAVTTAGASLEFDTQGGSYNSCYQIDSNHFINFWYGADADGYTQVFDVNLSTYAITTAAASLEFETDECTYNSCCQIDSGHYINFWADASDDGQVQVFAVAVPADPESWEVRTACGGLEFDTQYGSYNSCTQIDTNHFINFWQGTDDDGFVQTFTVNTSTW